MDSKDSGIRISNKKTRQKYIPTILIPEWLPKKRALKLYAVLDYNSDRNFQL